MVPQARQTDPASPVTLGHKLDSLMEVESEQETVRSMEELRRKLEDISRKASYQDTSQPGPVFQVVLCSAPSVSQSRRRPLLGPFPG